MTLLKQFTGWATDSNRTPKQMFQRLRCRFLLTYLTVMATVLGMSSIAVYVFFTRSHEQHLNNQLLTLAQAAVPSLNAVKTEGLQSVNQDLPWRELFKRDQSLEWFDANGKILARKGKIFSTLPLKRTNQNIQQQGQIRTLTIAVYSDSQSSVVADSLQRLELEGYIRANESTKEIESAIARLVIGLGVGNAIALIFMAIGAVLLTQQTLEPIEKSFQRLKEFTADASHELRNPLTAISTAIEVMQSHPERVHPSDAKKLVAIASAADQLVSLSEDLLFLARTDAVVAPPAGWKYLYLNEILYNVVELFKPYAQEKGIVLKLQLIPSILVNSEPAQLKRLFANLVDNALKYTITGGSVIISMVQQKRYVVVRVEDNGIGIAPEYLPFVFQRFWRADKARSPQTKGLGLGLAIAQTIAHQHGGKITVSSTLSVGSCFQVYLPTA
ncbi:HAMP domain-containing histidine kinase [Gloeocapsopsis crepidinum LEGE 06123]|uniref:histidine kinase n=1 Tax=Gloeocapsopsis crepidinum LEGE 06123 TaxID=588587 RepID=A0ABR9UXP5_9CHRO|nr:HAMP domain-containing sensor histidine kinase [Gloeocapsopsis crepidinum]MBE9193082.1 HAMP domain-containing histidine kinase [Gloeocapsopsis crepidinum LEGE 06123]